MRGATGIVAQLVVIRCVSIHAPHAGRDPPSRTPRGHTCCFNPRAPCGARPCFCARSVFGRSFNPRAPCGARRVSAITVPSSAVVSIHAPHAGRDSFKVFMMHSPFSFNPRAPCGARLLCIYFPQSEVCFNPRAPCGARLFTLVQMMRSMTFQSTRPMRGATKRERVCSSSTSFQSTRPMRGATVTINPEDFGAEVSIHAPHAGRDYAP